MKQMNLILGGAVCILALACTKEAPVVQETPVKLVPITFAVDNQATKTSLDYDNEKAVNWTDGDRVAIFDNNGGKVENQSFEVANDKIEAMVHDGATKFYALYPYNASATISGNVVVTTYIPSEQTAVTGSFGNNVNVAVAYTTTSEKSLSFKNTCALLKFTVEMDDVQSITITANGDYPMSGRSSITYSDGIVTKVSCEGSHSVTLTGPLTNGSTYFVAVAPQTYTGGIFMMIVRTDGTVLYKKGTSDLVAEMGTIKSLGTLSYDSTGTDPTKFKECDGLYGAYQAGMPLEICGEIVSSNNYKLVPVGDGDETYDIKPDLNGYDGIVFVKGSKPCSLTESAVNVGQDKRLVVVGNTPGQKLKLSTNGTKRFNINKAGASVYFKNVQFTAVGNYALSPGNFYIGKVFFDDCLLPGEKQLIYTSTGGGAESIRITNCKISLPSTVSDGKMQTNALGTTTTENYKEFVFRNNTVWSSSSTHIKFQFVTSSSSSTLTDESSLDTRVDISNNVFYNCLFNAGIVSFKKVKQAKIEGNIFRVSNNADANQKVLSIWGEQNEGISWTDNCYYYGGTSANATFTYARIGDTFMTNVLRLADDPFKSFDLETGEYELYSDYVGYGPQK